MPTLIAALTLLLSLPAVAHDLRPGAIALRETAPGTWTIRLTPAQDGGRAVDVTPRWPAGWEQTSPDTLYCPEGLRGTLVVPALSDARVKVVLRREPLDGEVEQVVLAEGQDRVDLGHPGTGGWLRLGLVHVLTGLDHVLFVAGLCLLATGWRRLLGAVTAFTAAHSLTLGLSAVGLVPAAGPAAELLIALSVLLVAREGLSDHPTLGRRHSWIVAGLFGLVHGLGFAGVLRDLGLPRDGLLAPLLAFNVGVELAQVLVLAGALLLASAWKRVGLHRGRRLAAYAVGLPAGVWVVGRGLAWAAG